MIEKNRDAGNVKVSFVIPCYDSEKTIARTIQSIKAQIGPLSREIIVIDSSEHDLVRDVASRFEGVMYEHSPARLYPGQARNLGARIAGGEYLAFVDADVSLQENWLVRLYSRLLTIPGAKAAGAALLNADEGTIPATVLYWMEFSEFLPGLGSGFRSFLSSSNLLIRRAEFLDSPGFDHELGMSEDVLFSASFQGRLYFDDTTSACHRHRSQIGEVFRHLSRLGYWAGRLRRSGAGRGTFLVKWRWLVPTLPFYRFLAVTRRVIKADPRQFPRVVLLSPLMLIGSFYWTSGFRRGISA